MGRWRFLAHRLDGLPHTVTDSSAGGRQQVAINGRAYVGNTPTIVAKTGERLRWYVFNLDLGEQWHNFHPHGQRFRVGHEVMDARSLGPAESFVVDTIVPPVILVPECDHHSHYDDDDHDHTPGSSPPHGGCRLRKDGTYASSEVPEAATQEIYARVLRRQQRAKVGAAFNELMYGARELAFRFEDETRSGGGDLLMRSPFEDAADPRG